MSLCVNVCERVCGCVYDVCVMCCVWRVCMCVCGVVCICVEMGVGVFADVC